MTKDRLESLVKKLVPRGCHAKIVSLFYGAKVFKYFIDTYECTVCGGRVRKFLPGGLDIPVFYEKRVVGGGCRPRVFCPLCRSTDRERSIYLFLKQNTDIFSKKAAVLHIAPEENLRDILLCCNNIDYLSADISSELAMVKMDITDITYEEGSFDVIICSHVLEHVVDDIKAMSELFRVLNPAGWAVLNVPISLSLDETFSDPGIIAPEERERVYGQENHVRLYAADFKDRLESVGFCVSVFNHLDAMDRKTVQYYGLSEENLYICRKTSRGEEAATGNQACAQPA